MENEIHQFWQIVAIVIGFFSGFTIWMDYYNTRFNDKWEAAFNKLKNEWSEHYKPCDIVLRKMAKPKTSVSDYISGAFITGIIFAVIAFFIYEVYFL